MLIEYKNKRKHDNVKYYMESFKLKRCVVSVNHNLPAAIQTFSNNNNNNNNDNNNNNYYYYCYY